MCEKGYRDLRSVFCGKSKYYGVCDIFSYRADSDPALDFGGPGPIWTKDLNYVLVLALFLVTAYIHEVLHGVGWCLGTKKKWKSIYIGMMWSSLTPYCHCKEPLEPGKYLIGCLLPGTLLGLGIYLAAFLTGSNVLLWLSLLNVLGAGGDLLIACTPAATGRAMC